MAAIPDRRHLRALKGTGGKRIESIQFSSLRRGRLPKPLDKLAGSRFSATPLYEVGDDVRVVFIAKSGETRMQRQLYGWAFLSTERGLLPLVRMDYHPSHKGLHMVVNCERGLDLTNRGLPGCREFALGDIELDADSAEDRNRFVTLFCERLRIDLGKPGGLI